MPIEFHCNHCGKMVRAGDEHAGKRGKCPNCHQSVYIPTPPEQIEPLELAPLDSNELAERERLKRESDQLAHSLRGERGEVPDVAPGAAANEDVAAGTDPETLVIDYVLAMADGNLNEAEKLAREIRKSSSAAQDIIQRLTMDEMPHRRLHKVPRAVVRGFLKQLHAE